MHYLLYTGRSWSHRINYYPYIYVIIIITTGFKDYKARNYNLISPWKRNSVVMTLQRKIASGHISCHLISKQLYGCLDFTTRQWPIVVHCNLNIEMITGPTKSGYYGEVFTRTLNHAPNILIFVVTAFTSSW